MFRGKGQKTRCAKVTKQNWGSQTSRWRVGVGRIEVSLVVSFVIVHPSITLGHPVLQDPVLGLKMKELQQCGDLAVTWKTWWFSLGNTRNDNFPAVAVRTWAQQGRLLGGQCCWASGWFWVGSGRSPDWLQGLDPTCLLSFGQITQIPYCWFLFLSLHFLLWYCSLAGDLLNFFLSSQKLRAL